MSKALFFSISLAGVLIFTVGCEKHTSEQVTVTPAPALASQRSIVVAPMPPSTGQLKTGANAQTALAPRINRLKTGPNAQTDLTPNIDRLKTGPNAQTDLTLKKSW